jgi:lipopolysaccharide/colanic/teichoic acid biosynthesis glycosyltransferase
VAKRAIELTLTIGVLITLGPLFLVIAALVRATSDGPILFRQERVGRDGHRFTMLKFRTMVVDNDDDAHRQMVESEFAADADPGTSDGVFKLENDPRVTWVGAWLRRSSLDELPQLWNVVRGDMALVGPRPSLPWEVDLFEPRFRDRERVRPGLTGLWQVSGRNRLSTLDMLELDLEYVRSWSLATDLSILVQTPAAVLRGDGAR